MPNQITENGIETQTYDEIVSEILDGGTYIDDTGVEVYVPGYRQIYGEDINIDPNSPDGQTIALYARSKLDALNLAKAVYSSMDPDFAFGKTLDMRCAINGIYRRQGTYSTISVAITVDRPLTLYGLSNTTSTTQPIFAVSDGIGNSFQLQDNLSFAAASTKIATFRAANLGAVTVEYNTVTNIDTPTPGVNAVNNPPYDSENPQEGWIAPEVGTNEESDAELRMRRKLMLGGYSVGYLESMLTRILALTNVLECRIYENDTNDTTGHHGVPPHSIWVIVRGGSHQEIAKAIYDTRSAGVGMKGEVVIEVEQVDGTTMDIKFDDAKSEPLYINIFCESPEGSFIDIKSMIETIKSSFNYKIGEVADSSAIVSLLKEQYPEFIFSTPDGYGVSNTGNTGTYVTYLNTTDVDNYFAIENVLINGASL